MKRFPLAVNVLFLTSFLLTVCRATTLTFITIYMMETFALKPDQAGLILGISVVISVSVSLYSGYLIDRFSHYRVIILAIVAISLPLFLFPWLNNIYLFAIMLTLMQAASDVFRIVTKACFAAWLPMKERIKAFSVNYTILNIGWAVGPALGIVATKYASYGPFILSGCISVLVLVLLSCWMYVHPHYNQKEASTVPLPGFRHTLSILGHDKRLIYFTLGSVMGAMVLSQFSVYMSQYLLTVTDAGFAYRIIAAVMTTNAVIVILFQYLLSSRITPRYLMRWLFAGSAFFIFGLIGFMHSVAVPVWVIAMILFTVGEIILLPAQYLFVDIIAPPHLKGSYYGAQNFGNIGGAITPVFCGLLLTYTPPQSMFYLLIAVMFIGLYFFYRGFRLMSGNGEATEEKPS